MADPDEERFEVPADGAFESRPVLFLVPADVFEPRFEVPAEGFVEARLAAVFPVLYLPFALLLVTVFDLILLLL